MTELRTAVVVRDAMPATAVKMAVRRLNFHYGDFHAIKTVSLDIPEKRVTAMIGPSGCGTVSYTHLTLPTSDLV